MSAALGVDVGGTSTRIVTVDGDDAIVRTHVSLTPRGATAVVDHIATLVMEALAAWPNGVVDVVGVGMPGRVDVARGTVATALNLDIDGPEPVRALLTARLGVPVVVENDVNAAALGAFEQYGLDDSASLAFMSVGTGFATGHVVDGHLHRGAQGGAGELGHVPVPGADVSCPCGQTGCLEAVASGGGMLRRWAALRPPTTARDAIHVPALWDAADRGDPAAALVRDDAVAAIAWAVQLTVMLLDVDVVALGGGVSRLGDRLLTPVAAVLRRIEHESPLIASAAPAARLRIVPADAELGALGAVHAARQLLARSPDEPEPVAP